MTSHHGTSGRRLRGPQSPSGSAQRLSAGTQLNPRRPGPTGKKSTPSRNKAFNEPALLFVWSFPGLAGCAQSVIISEPGVFIPEAAFRR